MKLIFKLAWRNVWRNKRRSMLTLAAICFATFASIAMRGMQHGTYAINIKYAVQLFSGYLQIQKKGYHNNPSLNKAFGNVKEIEKKLSTLRFVKGYAPRIYADGLISFKDNSFGAAVFGINPKVEKNVITLMNRLKDGRFFNSDTSNNIVIGYKLLENLKANIGDEVVILSQGADGSLGNLKFKIVGTLKTGSQEFDAMGVFMGIKKADELLAMYGRVHAIAIALYNLEDLEHAKEQIKQSLAGTGLTVLTWDELMPDFKQSIEFDNVSGILYLAILVIIVAFGILNTVLMSVTERFKEFGITLAIGMPQIKLVHLVLIETFFITIIGLLFGNIIGYGINSYFIHHPIEFGGDIAMIYQEYGFLPRIESSLLPSMFFNTTLTILAASLISCVYPLYKVFKLEPLKGIRYT
ncbi:ABC transporter permease [Melioribacteraceae bacterium 4301-Me]|uniref:ABC transporter permease n=1 Tax=Pyranulibacter aquaticus TaxID=3163344 RepID=UPI003596EC8B